MIVTKTLFMNHLRTVGTLAVLAATLSGCIGAVAVGAGAGALMLSDRRPTETYVTDEGIELRAANRFNERFGDKAHINITSINRMVLLTGEVADAVARADAEKIISAIPNVKSISNELAIGTPSTMSVRSNDSFITSKVKARFVDANTFAANHVKVVTEASVVYLLGIVTQAEANAAVEVARTTGGVSKVVRVFEIVSPQEAKLIDSTPSPSKKPGTPVQN